MEVKPKVLFCAFEATPFIKTGGLGDVAGSLPRALGKLGVSARLILPKLDTIPESYRVRMKHVADFTVQLGWRSLYCGVESLRCGGVTCYFIDNEYYFKRGAAYGFYDDGERIAFFSKAILTALPYLKNFFPDVLHLNDWHTALVPVLLKTQFNDDGRYSAIKTVFTIHNLRFQGQYSKWLAGDVLGLSDMDAEYHGLYRGDSLNYMQGALCCADRLTTVSPTYAREICTAQYGEGLEDVFLSKQGILSGILNGIDTKSYDPAADKCIPFHYSADNMSGKQRCKAALQAELGLEVDECLPLAIIVSRLTDQKGLDLVERVADEMLDGGIQLAILGTGERQYEEAFAAMAARHPGRMSAILRFDEALSHRMYAGADMVLMPSQFEPCGLTQMYALRCGCLPVVRETGGLKDSVLPYNRFTGEGTGFSFANYNAHELLLTVKDAAALYRSDRPAWDSLVRQAMAADFSWQISAEKYIGLYKELLGA